MIHAEEINKLKDIKDQDKVKLIRKMPWKVKKATWKLIARKDSEEKIIQVLTSIKDTIKTDLETATKYNYQRDQDTLIKFLKKYKRID